MEERLARRVIEAAKAEALPGPYGVVNDFQYDTENGQQVRHNWRRLKAYFEVAGKYSERNWRDPAVLDGVRGRNKRVPQNGASGIQWCGIFATYCWIKGGLTTVRWGWPNIVGANVRKTWGFKGVEAGDIAVIAANNLHHHFLIEKITGSNTDPSSVADTINGNSDYQGITRKKVTVGMIVAYYTYEDTLINKLSALYGAPR